MDRKQTTQNSAQNPNLDFIDFIQNLIQNQDPNEYKDLQLNQQFKMASAIIIDSEEEEEVQITPIEFVQFKQVFSNEEIEEEVEIEDNQDRNVKQQPSEPIQESIQHVQCEMVEQSDEIWPQNEVVDLISDQDKPEQEKEPEQEQEESEQEESEQEESEQEESEQDDEQDVEKVSSQFSGNPFDDFAAEIQDEEDFILEEEKSSEEIIGNQEEIRDEELSGDADEYNGDYEQDSFINDEDDQESDYSEKKHRLRKVSDIEKRKKLRKQKKAKESEKVSKLLKKMKESKKSKK